LIVGEGTAGVETSTVGDEIAAVEAAAADSVTALTTEVEAMKLTIEKPVEEKK